MPTDQATASSETNSSKGTRRGFPVRLFWLVPAPVAALIVLGTRLGYWWLPVSVLVVMSITTYVLFAIDKRRAQSELWRIPESTLHLCELAGGWPGAVLAQNYVRHKSSKVVYRFVLWLIIIVHNYVAVDFLLGWKVTRWIGQLASM